MDNLQKLFSDALREHGVDAEVTAVENPTRMSTTVHVEKDIGGNRYHKECSFSHRQLMSDNPDIVAMQARQVAQDIEQQTTERITWLRNAVDVEATDDGGAECLRCGATVDLKPNRFRAVRQDAEMGIPRPISKDTSEMSKTKLMFYLLARLRSKCDSYCENSNRTERLKW